MMPRSSPQLTKRLAEVLIMAAVYYVAAKLALLLAIPPGYATAVWPAAGLALAGILLLGYGVWPGILLGSFLANFLTYQDATDTFSIVKSILLPASIGIGASLQAIVGTFLARRLPGYPNSLTQEQDIIKFLFLGGPASCLIGATFGVTSLLLADRIQWMNYSFNWWTWWIGDTIGVLIFTPLVLIWFAKPGQVWLRGVDQPVASIRRLLVSLPLCVMFALVVLVFVYTSSREEKRIQYEFERRAEQLAHELEKDFNSYLEVLYSIKSLYASSSEVYRQEFRSFVEPLLSRHPGFQALSWNPRIPDAERAAFERAVRREGYYGFQITEQNAKRQVVRASQRPEYLSVQYIEPYAGNESALGFDAASDPTRAEASNQARDTGNPIATRRLTLIQERGHQFGLVVFLPIYRRGLPHNTLEERRQNLQGYVAGVFRIANMMGASLKDTDNEGIVARLYDYTAPERERLLYDSRPQGQESKFPSTEDKGKNNPTELQRTIPLDIAGRQWALEFTPTSEYLIANRALQAWSILAGGLLFTGLLGAFLLVVTGRTAGVEELVSQRTAELRTSEEGFRTLAETAKDAIVSADSHGNIIHFNKGAEQMFGYSADEVIGKPLTLLMPEKFREAHQHGFRRFLLTGEAHVIGKTVELSGRRESGNEFPLELSLASWQAGEETFFTGILRDITERKMAEKELQGRNALVKLLQVIAVASNEASTIEGAMQTALDEICVYTGWPIGHVYMPAEDSIGGLVPTNIWHLEDSERFKTFRNVTQATRLASGAGLPGRVLVSRKPEWIADVTKDLNFPRARQAEDIGVRAGFGFPVLVEKEIVAVLEFFSDKVVEANERLLEIMAQIGPQLGRVVERNRAEESLKKAHNELEIRVQERTGQLSKVNKELQNEIIEREKIEKALRKSVVQLAKKNRYETIISSVTRSVHQSINLENVLENAAEAISKNIEAAENISLFLVEGEQAVLKAYRGYPDWFIERVKTIPYGKGVTWKTIIEGKPLYCGDAEKDTVLGPAGKEVGTKSYVCMPVHFKGKVVGTININSLKKNAFDESELNLLEIVAQQIEVAINNAKQAEALRESEERLRRSVVEAPIPILIHDEDDKVLQMSNGWTKFSGYTIEDIPTIEDWTERAYGERKQQVKRYIDGLFEINETVSNGEWVINTKEGTERVWDFYTTPLGRSRNGRRILLSIAVDLTERKQAEEKLRESEERFHILADSAPALIWVNGPEGCEFVNSGYLEFLGVSVTDVRGYDWAEFIHPEDRDDYVNAYLRAMNQRGLFEAEFRFRRHDGEYRWMRSVGQPRIGPNRELLGYAGLTIDTTERKQAEEWLRTLNETLEQRVAERTQELARSNAELQQFAYIASHDLQEPLRMVASFMQLLERRYRDKLDSDAKEFIGFAVDGAKRMQTLINDLLTYSRVGTHGKPFEPTDCETVLKQTIDNLKMAIEESGAVVTHSSLPTVMADASQLVQLFQNLIGNAVKFRNNRPPEIYVSAQKIEEFRIPGSEFQVKSLNESETRSPTNSSGTKLETGWVFSIRDNGIGIDLQYAERIFAIFQRLHTRNEYSGTGIGLAICKKIVERNGGRIWVESEVGKGATFYFTIPTRDTEGEDVNRDS